MHSQAAGGGADEPASDRQIMMSAMNEQADLIFTGGRVHTVDATNDVVPALQQWQKRQLRCGQQLVDRAREIGNRLQFESSWIVGQEIPFGLYRPGDSAFQS